MSSVSLTELLLIGKILRSLERRFYSVSHITYDVRHRLVGFDELGMSDTFKTSVLEDRLAKCSMSASCAPLP